MRSYLENSRAGVTQAVVYLPSKHEGLSSNPSTAKKKKKKKKKIYIYIYIYIYKQSKTKN
jgi:hypothetical protein